MRSLMRNVLSVMRIAAMVAGLVLLAPINPGRATGDRDFADFDEVSNVTDLGDTVSPTLTMCVSNYSDADVSAAIVRSHESEKGFRWICLHPGFASDWTHDTVPEKENFRRNAQ